MAPDPKADLRDFIRSRFDNSAVSVPFTAADDVQIANYDTGPKFPEVAIVSNDPVIPGGGEARVTAIDGSGGGPVQDQIFSILVDCWGGPDNDQVYQQNDSDPDTVAVELGNEVHDITFAGTDAPAGYEWISSEPPRDANDTKATPTEHRQQVVVRMKYTKKP